MPRGVIIPCVYGCSRRFSGQESHDRHRDWSDDRCRSDHELAAKGYVQKQRGIWQRDPSHRVSASVGQSALFAPTVVVNTEARALARSSDPITSVLAARAVAPRTGSMKARLLEAYRDAPEGLTDFEAALRTGLPHQSVTKRAADLRREGLIEPVDRRSGPFGVPVRVCRVSQGVSA